MNQPRPQTAGTARPYSSRLYNKHIGSRLFSSRRTSRNIPTGHYITKYDYVDRYRVLNWTIEQMGLEIAEQEATEEEEQRPKVSGARKACLEHLPCPGNQAAAPVDVPSMTCVTTTTALR